VSESRWQKWLKENANRDTVNPLDLFNPYTEYTSEQNADERFAICKECPFYVGLTHQCKKCGCVMNIKTKLLHATCPIGKW
jgi:hypothetical protein